MKKNKRKISDLGTIVGGGTPNTNKVEYYNGNIAWITPKDLIDNKSIFINRGERMITSLGLNNWCQKNGIYG
ncbi:hypothetical protein JM47_00725 [Ureaplasma diversum]|uniref:Type I restriction modification DNA specificity domain-containing protein n=1 Tax=Ureaplasma diversum TaxID=42094 RepID=A0A0C5RL60_9BACT|nr:hypothetical protein [Ureaplasma diversum]AJQ45172.1 hypothetical protein JM47_00725 [Ureaplasma diversum]